MCRVRVRREVDITLRGMAYRIDGPSPITKRTTVQGGLILPAAITRTGVFTYYNVDGSVASKELRHPDEVFKKDSLATLASAPVTVRHPQARKVDPSNWREVTVGTIDGEGRQDGIHVAADVRVQDAGTIKAVENKHLVEISAGYHCKTDKQEGVYEGEAFTHIQRDIRYNHVALLPAGNGRGGSTCALRTDDAGDSLPNEEELEPLVNDTLTPEGTMLTPEQIKALETERDTLKTKNDALEAQVKGVEALNGQIAYLKGEVLRLDTALKAAGTVDQTKTDALVDARVSLVTEARLVLDEKDKPFQASGKSDHDVRVAVLTKLQPTFKCDGKSEGHVAGAYDMAISAYRMGAAGLASVQGATPAAKAGDAHTDAKDTIAEARQVAAKASADAWKTPRAISAK